MSELLKKRAVAYLRVSSEEQTEGWSLDGQERQIREYAEKNGYQIVQVYQDDTTGSKDRRPGLERMLMDAHAGLFTAIIVLHTSRLFRNVALARFYKDQLRNRLNIEVLFINQPSIDPDDPMAFVIETFNELFDEYYLHQLRFWTTLGKQTRAQRGLWNGTLPFGYVTGENGMPVPHPKNADGLIRAFEAYSTGRYSDRQIAELLNREGYLTSGQYGERPFTKDTINRLLKNDFYLGYTQYKGERFSGVHPPLVDQALFDKCQEVRARRRLKSRAIGTTRQVYVLAGLARCHECGLTLRCASTESGGRWRYYRHTAQERGFECSVPPKFVRADKIEPQWSEIVSSIRLPGGWREKIESMAGDKDERAAILRERDVVQERLRRLKQLYKDLLIDPEEYQRELESYQSRLAALVLPSSPHVIQAGEYLESLGLLWDAATLAEQRDITRVILKRAEVDVLAARIVAIEPLPIFKMLIQDICDDLQVDVL